MNIHAFLAWLVVGAALSVGQVDSAHTAHASADHRGAATGNYRFYNIDLGGYKLFMQCTGHSHLTVLFEAGAWSDSSEWFQVLPALAANGHEASGPQAVQYCTYDRAGEGASDPSPHGRDASTIVRELHAVLTKAHIAPPYILVGHSIGGLYIRLYAYTYPHDVVGLVLVDSVNEEGWDDLSKVGFGPAICSGNTGCAENAAWRQDRAEMRQADQALGPHPLGSRPLVVLTATLKDAPILRVWLKYQQELTTLSTNSRQLFDPLSQHVIPTDSPDFVKEAVEKVVAAVRQHSQLPPVKAWRCGDGSGFCH